MQVISPQLMFNCSCLLCADKKQCVFDCSHSSMALSGTQATTSCPYRWPAPAIALSGNQLSIFDYSTPCICTQVKWKASASYTALLYFCLRNNLEINNSLFLGKVSRGTISLCDTQGLRNGPYF